MSEKKLTIGLLTSGGDCQALNATMRGIVKTLANNIDELEVYGFINGYQGMIYGDYRLLTSRDFSGILTKGGTMLGSSRTPFKDIRKPDEKGLDKVEAMKQNYYKLRLDCLFVLGGNGSQKTAHLLSEEGLNVIHLPKTIDNDIWGTDMTFGFYSAVNIATEAIDCIHTTAASHNRVFILEVMGRDAGWIALHSAIAGGADVCLIPEIPYDIQKVKAKIEQRYNKRRGYCIIVVAEGAMPKGGTVTGSVSGEVGYQHIKLGGVGEQLAADLKAAGVEHDIRYTILGHLQRGGTPIAFDRVLATEFGVRAMEFVMEGRFGQMVAYHHPDIVGIPLEEAVREQNLVAPDSRLVHTAKGVGIEFGD